MTYSYFDDNWKDKLSSYKIKDEATGTEIEQKIIYDAIGNPLEYRGSWDFEWARGKRLDKALNSWYNISYKYDDAGIRTEKTVNGTKTEFVTSGIQILAQKCGQDVLTWQIDGNGFVLVYVRIRWFDIKVLPSF